MDYVLRFDKPVGFYANQLDYYEGQSNAMSYVISYANFLKQKLELWMFVPCKFVEGVWVVLEEPKRWNDFLQYPESFDGNKEWYELYEYQEAKDRVLFEGFEIKNHDKTIICQSENIISMWKHLEEDWILGFDCIEDLVKYNLELTPTAQKQIGLK